jgi:hypothetical protein
MRKINKRRKISNLSNFMSGAKGEYGIKIANKTIKTTFTARIFFGLLLKNCSLVLMKNITKVWVVNDSINQAV